MNPPAETVTVRSYLSFVGIRTSGSSVFPVSPHWMRALGEDAEVRAHDLPLDADPSRYRSLLHKIRDDDRCLGAVITSHKVNLYRHARDLIDEVDPHCEACGEVSVLVKRGRSLVGMSISSSMLKGFDELAGPEAGEREVVCFGAGGAGSTLALGLLDRPERSRRVVLADSSAARLRWLKERLGRYPVLEFEFIDDQGRADELVRSLPPGSVVVNATGLGKDAPGSPVSDEARLPRGGIAWDCNYRGDLRFLDDARRQAGDRDLRVEDGWRLFVHSWVAGLEAIFDLKIDEELFSSLAQLAEPFRPVRA